MNILRKLIAMSNNDLLAALVHALSEIKNNDEDDLTIERRTNAGADEWQGDLNLIVEKKIAPTVRGHIENIDYLSDTVFTILTKCSSPRGTMSPLDPMAGTNGPEDHLYIVSDKGTFEVPMVSTALRYEPLSNTISYIDTQGLLNVINDEGKICGKPILIRRKRTRALWHDKTQIALMSWPNGQPKPPEDGESLDVKVIDLTTLQQVGPITHAKYHQNGIHDCDIIEWKTPQNVTVYTYIPPSQDGDMALSVSHGEYVAKLVATNNSHNVTFQKVVTDKYIDSEDDYKLRLVNASDTFIIKQRIIDAAPGRILMYSKKNNSVALYAVGDAARGAALPLDPLHNAPSAPAPAPVAAPAPLPPQDRPDDSDDPDDLPQLIDMPRV